MDFVCLMSPSDRGGTSSLPLKGPCSRFWELYVCDAGLAAPYSAIRQVVVLNDQLGRKGKGAKLLMLTARGEGVGVICQMDRLGVPT